MSGIKGKQRKITEEFVKKVGLFECTVLAINPTVKEFEDILGIPPREDDDGNPIEINYIGVSKDGNPYLRVDVWLKRAETEEKYKAVFFLEDKIRQNKDETKTQYINNIGTCSWAESEDDLPSWFAARDYREAKNGEEDFYNFLQTWLGALNYREETTELQLNWKKLMKGDVSEIKDQIGGDYDTQFVALATIVTKVKEDKETGEEEIIEYQGIYNRQFLPQYCMKHFRVKDYTDDIVIANIQGREPKKLKLHEKFVYNVTGEYGCKNFYKLSEISEYDPTENVVASDDAMMSEETADSEY